MTPSDIAQIPFNVSMSQLLASVTTESSTQSKDRVFANINSTYDGTCLRSRWVLGFVLDVSITKLGLKLIRRLML